MTTTRTTPRGLLRAGVAGVVVLVLGGLPAWAATGSGAPSCSARGVATLVSSTEKDDTLAEIADRWNRDVRHLGQPCIQVVGVTSGLAEQRIASKGYDWTFPATDRTVEGEPLPNGSTLDAWSPSASLWLRLLENDRPSGSDSFFDLEPRPIARSPLVAVGAPAAIAALRDRTEKGVGLGWPDLVTALYDSRDDLRYTQENALLSTSGAQAALTLSLNLPVSVVTAPEYLRELQSATDSVNDSTTIVADWADRGVAPEAVILLQAQIAWAYNNGYYSLLPGESEADRNDASPGPPPTSKLDLYLPKPARGAASSYVSDHPFFVRTTGEHAEAMRGFYRYLREHVEVLCARGYFDVDSACAPPTMDAPAEVASRFAALATTRETLVPTTADDTLAAWNVLRTPRALLVLVDVSGSQSEAAQQAKAAALAAASDRLRLDRQRFGSAASDRLTVWAVGRTWKRVSLPRNRSLAGWQSALATATAAADPGFSDILGAVCAAQTQQADWGGTGTTSSVVLLSDGVQDLDDSPQPGDLNALFPKGSVSRSCPQVTKTAPTYAVHYALNAGSYGSDNAALDRSGRELMERLGGQGLGGRTRYREAALDKAVLTDVVRDILRSPSG